MSYFFTTASPPSLSSSSSSPSKQYIEPKLKVKSLSFLAQLPQYGSSGAAGLDLFSVEAQIIPARQRAKIRTGIAIEWECDTPSMYYMRIAARSGLSINRNIDVGAGVIDCDYRGEIMVCLINNGDIPFTVTEGDKIAQMIWTRCDQFREINWIDSDSILTDTSRGECGFGSTGK